MSLERVLQRQQILSDKIACRFTTKRTKNDIMTSLIAECIEFNEETDFTHKSWVKKDTNSREKQLEELVDILFFIAEYINTQEEWIKESFCSSFDLESSTKLRIQYDKKDLLLSLMQSVLNGFMHKALSYYIHLYRKMRFTKEQILNQYDKKWEINMQRIENDWRM
jgi:dimeric dUTPase (all-alpha-NTP-PPase superfamily)